MTILHYILGFPPHRSGGLTNYALDLIQAERELGHTVFILYPGNVNILSCDKSTFKVDVKRKQTYVLTNALPVPLLYGIRNASDFMEKRELVGFDDFIATIKPDVFHVHTLMGLPKELLLKMKGSNIRIVYTSHDYFGLCPKVNFINSQGKVCEGPNSTRCEECNDNAPCKIFLKIRNSKYLVPLKQLLR